MTGTDVDLLSYARPVAHATKTEQTLSEIVYIARTRADSPFEINAEPTLSAGTEQRRFGHQEPIGEQN